MKISVIVPTYRRPEYLRRCVKAIAEQTRNPDEVIVVIRETDSASKRITTRLQTLHEEAFVLKYEYKVKGYVGGKVEVDPRLSEVSRWWLDKTAPNCEIIFDGEKAEEVLNKFLDESNMEEIYFWSQRDLRLLLYIYSGTEFEEEVYNDLITRLPGLAYDDSLTDENVGLA